MKRLWALVFAVGVTGSAVAQEDTTVWVASPWQRVLRDTPASKDREVEVKAAANEFAPFRVIVRAGKSGVNEVTAAMSGLESDAGTIPASNIQMFRAHYLHIPEPSHRTENPKGWYPDALIPFVHPRTGKALGGDRYDAVPFDIEPGQNGEIWCDLFVPPGTEAGVYRGVVTVESGAVKLAQVPVQLRVWEFELSDSFALRSSFGNLGRRVTEMVIPEGTAEEAAAIEDLYIAELLRHRAVPGSLGDIWPAWTPANGIEDTGQAERLRRLVEEEHVNALRIPFRYQDDPKKAKAYLAAMAEWLRELGYLDLAYVYLKDEPNDAEEYEIVRQQGALIHEADPDIRRLCTEQTVTSNPAWGDLYGAVDIWCPLWGLWDEPTARERLELGERLWSYTALCQGPEGTPWWQIDMEPLNFRAPFWVSWRYDITGFLYWSSVYWQAYETMEGVWERPAFRDQFWGEGMLLYPGQPAGLEGPVPSIRLKLIREALEDYQYMAMAAGRERKGQVWAVTERQSTDAAEAGNGHGQVDRIVRGVVDSFQDWSRDPQDYQDARERLAELILGRK
ncbi:MAG: glycoside hydrolase domain-containing protein [Planctomycetota bacterium]